MKEASKINVTHSDLALICGKSTLTLTPNNRTTVNLLSRAVGFKLEQSNKNACETPAISPLSGWVCETFDSLRASNIPPFNKLAIIGEQEILSYWVKIIHCDQQAESLVNQPDWVSQALTADKVLSRWLVSDYMPDTPLSANFKRWRVSVHKEIKSKGYVTPSMALELIIEAIENETFIVPSTVALYAFDERPPLYQKLFDAIGQKGSVIDVNPCREDCDWLKVATDTVDNQIEHAAKWASQLVEADPTKTIAIVCPDLGSKRGEIIEKLNNVFEPQWILPETKVYSAPFDISLGEPLTSIPLIKRALYYIDIENNEIETEQVISLVNDIFICSSNEEKFKRRKFANSLRDNRSHKTGLVKLAMKGDCPEQLQQSLAGFTNTMSNHRDFLYPSNWAQLFKDGLSNLGWVDGLTVNTVENAALTKWGECLDALCGLDMHVGEISKNLAVTIFSSLCSSSVVTPEGKGSPISVLGCLEAAGLDFDYIWVMDCNANVFPPKAELNAFLPVTLQIERKMPHSSGEREFEFTNALFKRYKQSCSQLITSYALKDRYGDMLPAPALDNAYEVADFDRFLDQDVIDYKEICFQRFHVQEKDDEIGILSTNAGFVSGGVGLIDKINACPMQAVFSNRIEIRTVDTNYTPGLTSQEKGNALHQALEMIWQNIAKQKTKNNFETDHAALLSYSSGELAQLINLAVEDAIFWVNRDDIEEKLCQSEKALLNETLKQWMRLETDRTPFDILATEQTEFAQLGSFRIKIVNDRVVQVHNEGNSQIKLAEDYKSTEHSISGAFSSTISSQLPLAALTTGASGVGYLNVIPNNPTISGVVEGEVSELTQITRHRYKGPKNWVALKEAWLEKMTALLDSYVYGQMKYTPSSQSCMYCVKRSLCEYSAA